MMIRMIIGRCYVGDSNRKVIKYVISRMKNGYTTWSGIDKKARRAMLSDIVAEHRKNRELYDYVQRGAR